MKKKMLIILACIILLLLAANSIKIKRTDIIHKQVHKYNEGYGVLSMPIRENAEALKVYDCKVTLTLTCTEGELKHSMVIDNDVKFEDVINSNEKKEYTYYVGNILEDDIKLDWNYDASNSKFKGNLCIKAEFKESILDYLLSRIVNN